MRLATISMVAAVSVLLGLAGASWGAGAPGNGEQMNNEAAAAAGMSGMNGGNPADGPAGAPGTPPAASANGDARSSACESLSGEMARLRKQNATLRKKLRVLAKRPNGIRAKYKARIKKLEKRLEFFRKRPAMDPARLKAFKRRVDNAEKRLNKVVSEIEGIIGARP